MKYKNYSMVFVTILIIASFSCKKFVEVDPPKNSLVPASVFANDDLATAAVLGIYQQMASTDYSAGGSGSVGVLCGLTADELIGYDTGNKTFYQNSVTPENGPLTLLWNSPYNDIYNANSILEGLNAGSGVTPPVKAQLMGEAYFIRAFSYFYLVNLFGPVPLYLTSDYKSNSTSVRVSETTIYAQIISDLKLAESLLGDTYITTERVRPNKSTIDALLARTYLYEGDWVNAEKYSSQIIQKTTIYGLVPINDVFLKNSMETIWQLMPAANHNSNDGNFYILTSGSAGSNVSLNPNFALNGFEPGDQRQVNWIQNLVQNGVTYYYPFKYKIQSSPDVKEYTMVFRLAEQYLIRAEARAQQNNLNGAIDDIDKIRFRAGLQSIKATNPGIDKNQLLTSLQKERFVELFSEWGHRWFDLKRTGQSTLVLSLTKPNWKQDDVLFPIIKAEIQANPNITQNKGY